MIILRRLAFLGFFIIAAIPQGWAQITAPIAVSNSSGTLTVYGLNFTVSGCTYVVNGTTTACSSDGAVLQGVQSGRDTISLQLIHSDLNPASSAVQDTSTSGATSLTFTVSVTPSGSYVGTKASAAILKDVGTDVDGGIGSPTFTTTITSAPFTTAPAITWSSSSSQQSLASPQESLTSLLDTFSFTEHVSLTSNGSTLKLNTMTMKFYTTPEPASISALLVGLTGLVMVRRKRQAS